MMVIGIDAGGSNTRVIACSLERLEADTAEDFEYTTLGSANFTVVGESGVRKLIRDVVERLGIEDRHRLLVLGGFAGAGSPGSLEAIARLFESEGFLVENVAVTSDAGIILRALGGVGIALIAGTGSICAARRASNQDRREDFDARAGGYGYRLPSEAGGYGLGIGAIDAALRVADGRGREPTVLYQRVRDHFELDDVHQVTSVLYPSGEVDRVAVTERVSGLAGVVLQAAHEGDRVALELVGKTVDELADLVLTVTEKIGLTEPVIGLHGGLFADPHGEELLISPLRDRLERMGICPEYVTFGIKEGDRDPLLEAMRFTFVSR